MKSESNDSSRSILFSYHKNHQQLIHKISSYLQNRNYSIQMNYYDENFNQNKIVVCFLTPIYQSSKSFQQIIENNQISIIFVYILPNWKPSGWINKITNHFTIVDLRGINEKNFQEKIKDLENKIIQFNENQIKSREISFEDQTIMKSNYPLIENSSKKTPIQYRLIPLKCRLNLSNLIICNDEYILIHGNNHFHLFDQNLKLIRSTKNHQIHSNDLKDFSWSEDSNQFIILTRKNVFLMNPITTQLTIIENIKLKTQQEEYLCCTSSNDKFFIVKSQFNSNLFYFEQFYSTTFRFIEKYSINHLIEPSLFVQNRFLIKNSIQQITSIRFYQNKLAMIIEYSHQWFIYLFHLYDKPTFFTKIQLEEQARLTICDSINQWIIFTPFLANSFIQFSIDFKENSQDNRQQLVQNYSKAFIDFDGKLRSLAPFRSTNLVLLIDDALVIYRLDN